MKNDTKDKKAGLYDFSYYRNKKKVGRPKKKLNETKISVNDSCGKGTNRVSKMNSQLCCYHNTIYDNMNKNDEKSTSSSESTNVRTNTKNFKSVEKVTNELENDSFGESTNGQKKTKNYKSVEKVTNELKNDSFGESTNEQKKTKNNKLTKINAEKVTNSVKRTHKKQIQNEEELELLKRQKNLSIDNLEYSKNNGIVVKTNIEKREQKFTAKEVNYDEGHVKKQKVLPIKSNLKNDFNGSRQIQRTKKCAEVTKRLKNCTKKKAILKEPKYTAENRLYNLISIVDIKKSITKYNIDRNISENYNIITGNNSTCNDDPKQNERNNSRKDRSNESENSLRDTKDKAKNEKIKKTSLKYANEKDTRTLSLPTKKKRRYDTSGDKNTEEKEKSKKRKYTKLCRKMYNLSEASSTDPLLKLQKKVKEDANNQTQTLNTVTKSNHKEKERKAKIHSKAVIKDRNTYKKNRNNVKKPTASVYEAADIVNQLINHLTVLCNIKTEEDSDYHIHIDDYENQSNFVCREYNQDNYTFENPTYRPNKQYVDEMEDRKVGIRFCRCIILSNSATQKNYEYEFDSGNTNLYNKYNDDIKKVEQNTIKNQRLYNMSNVSYITSSTNNRNRTTDYDHQYIELQYKPQMAYNNKITTNNSLKMHETQSSDTNSNNEHLYKLEEFIDRKMEHKNYMNYKQNIKNFNKCETTNYKNEAGFLQSLAKKMSDKETKKRKKILQK